MKLHEYVKEHTIRGACMCGQCINAPEHPEKHQPAGHTADLVFFKVALVPHIPHSEPSMKDEFICLVKARYPHWLDGKEHNYLEMGGDMGDQGIALTTMGLGYLLGVWKLLTPRIMFGKDCPEDLEKQMAGRGFISIVAEKS